MNSFQKLGVRWTDSVAYLKSIGFSGTALNHALLATGIYRYQNKMLALRSLPLSQSQLWLACLIELSDPVKFGPPLPCFSKLIPKRTSPRYYLWKLTMSSVLQNNDFSHSILPDFQSLLSLCYSISPVTHYSFIRFLFLSNSSLIPSIPPFVYAYNLTTPPSPNSNSIQKSPHTHTPPTTPTPIPSTTPITPYDNIPPTQKSPDYLTTPITPYNNIPPTQKSPDYLTTTTTTTTTYDNIPPTQKSTDYLTTTTSTSQIPKTPN